jgi:hypothetical protein
MSPNWDAATEPTVIKQEKQRDRLMGQEAVFHYGTGFWGKKAGKAGNSGNSLYFIMKQSR